MESYSDLTPEQIAILEVEVKRLDGLPNDVLIMMALSEIVSSLEYVPIGKRVTLVTVLEKRSEDIGKLMAAKREPEDSKE